MKFIRLIGHGNSDPHLIPIKNIADINFKKGLTQFVMTGGVLINVTASEEEITELLKKQGGDIMTLKSKCTYPSYQHEHMEGMDYWSYSNSSEVDPSK